jgi:tRNA pseudouridine13 synthase
MSSCDSAGSPRKRIKLSAEMQTATEPISIEPIPSEAIPTSLSHDDRAAHIAKEGEVGITDFVSTSTPGFSGVLKKRYTDFLVNEILPNGKVVHLQSVGSAAVSQLDGESQRVVTAEETGTEASVSGVPDPSAMISLPATTKESPQANNGKTEHPEEGRPVRPAGLDLAFKLTHAPGFC